MGKGGRGSGELSAKKALKVGLVEKNGALTPNFKTVLGEVFRRFDVDGDGALSEVELEAFATTSGSGSKIDAAERRQLGTLFDTDKAGNLTKKGFEQMYQMNIGHQPEDVWNDLTKLGYDRTALAPRDPAAAAAADAAEAAKAAEAALVAERMEEMKAAMGALKLHQDSAEAHRRVGKALEALGRGEAAARSFLKASELDGKLNSTVEEID